MQKIKKLTYKNSNILYKYKVLGGLIIIKLCNRDWRINIFQYKIKNTQIIYFLKNTLMTPTTNQTSVLEIWMYSSPETFQIWDWPTSLMVNVNTQDKIARIEGLWSIQEDNNIIQLLSETIKELTSRFRWVTLLVVSTIESNRARLAKILFSPEVTESLNIDRVTGWSDDSAATLFFREPNEANAVA